jgi:hypothetical protein
MNRLKDPSGFDSDLKSLQGKGGVFGKMNLKQQHSSGEISSRLRSTLDQRLLVGYLHFC